MIKTILFDMGGTLEDIWYNDQTIRTVTGELRTFLDEHDLGTGCNDITFWNKLNSGIRTYKQWSESNELEKKPEEIWPEYYMAVRRGLEPLTPCVTGTYSNQLN